MLLLASTLGVMAGAIIAPVLELIRSDLDVTGTTAGLIITTHGLTIALSSPVVGKLIDRWGVRGTLALVVYGVGGGAGMFARPIRPSSPAGWSSASAPRPCPEARRSRCSRCTREAYDWSRWYQIKHPQMVACVMEY